VPKLGGAFKTPFSHRNFRGYCFRCPIRGVLPHLTRAPNRLFGPGPDYRRLKDKSSRSKDCALARGVDRPSRLYLCGTIPNGRCPSDGCVFGLELISGAPARCDFFRCFARAWAILRAISKRSGAVSASVDLRMRLACAHCTAETANATNMPIRKVIANRSICALYFT
jgi:hypothetical protein